MMKLLILTVLSALFPLLAFSKSPCEKKLTCWKSAPVTAEGLVHAITSPGEHFRENPGIYYAFGKGKSCQAAQINGKTRLMNEFDYLACDGDVKCGVNGGVYTGGKSGCSKTSKGEYITWVKCDNTFHGEIIHRPQPDTNGGGIILIETAKRWEVRARASK